jgi:hypothetical protein
MAVIIDGFAFGVLSVAIRVTQNPRKLARLTNLLGSLPYDIVRVLVFAQPHEPRMP